MTPHLSRYRRLAFLACAPLIMSGLAGLADTASARPSDPTSRSESSRSQSSDQASSDGQQARRTPRARHGQLSVCGRTLCDERGRKVQLRGMSTNGTQWYPHCLTPRSLRILANRWEADVLRVSTYPEEGGYADQPRKMIATAERIARQASARGMYVVIDWHVLNPGDPSENLRQATRFFRTMAEQLGEQDNIIYEIAAEPNGVSWAEIRKYSTKLIPRIRKIDPEAPIVVGTPAWSTFGLSEGMDPLEVSQNPLDFENLLYGFHFYAAAHQDSYLAALDQVSA
ncbi:MAG: glycoside hydrolase family 5 protein, partial [Nocardioides sp.]